MKRSVTSSTSPLMSIEGTAGKSWPMTLVFLMLIVSPNSLQAWANLLISYWRPSSVFEVRAASGCLRLL